MAATHRPCHESRGEVRHGPRLGPRSALRSQHRLLLHTQHQLRQLGQEIHEGHHRRASFLPLSLRTTQVHIREGTFDHDKDAMAYINSHYFTYAWVSPSFDDSFSTVAFKRSDSRSSDRNRRRTGREGRPTSRGFGPASQPPPPHSPPGATFVPSPTMPGPIGPSTQWTTRIIWKWWTRWIPILASWATLIYLHHRLPARAADASVHPVEYTTTSSSSAAACEI